MHQKVGKKFFFEGGSIKLKFYLQRKKKVTLGKRPGRPRLPSNELWCQASRLAACTTDAIMMADTKSRPHLAAHSGWQGGTGYALGSGSGPPSGSEEWSPAEKLEQCACTKWARARLRLKFERAASDLMRSGGLSPSLGHDYTTRPRRHRFKLLVLSGRASESTHTARSALALLPLECGPTWAPLAHSFQPRRPARARQPPTSLVRSVLRLRVEVARRAHIGLLPGAAGGAARGGVLPVLVLERHAPLPARHQHCPRLRRLRRGPRRRGAPPDLGAVGRRHRRRHLRGRAWGCAHEI